MNGENLLNCFFSNHKHMKYGTLAIFVFIFAGCDNDDNMSMVVGEQGTWVEVHGRTDTLTFESFDDIKIVSLARAREMRNGQWVPKARTGPYNYKIESGKISLYWLLSSSYTFTEYNFHQEGNRLVIGDFFNSPPRDSLTFQRVR
jgi:hypothetical protein